MATQTSGRPRRSRGGKSRRGGGDRPYRPTTSTPKPPAKQTLWEKITGFFSGSARPEPKRAEVPRMNGSHPKPESQPRQERSERSERPSRKPEQVEVTTPRLYVGNLSFEATESDLFELFNGVGAVQNAEVVTYKHNQRSKGFAFVQMNTVEEARRAVTELHDKEFLGRKLLVSGAKSSDRQSD
ncbi:MAG: RNA-binding protein [Verrucomicrobiota bacterium]|nr:RNA-binding protein [Verrucomicrobiota bacterium]